MNKFRIIIFSDPKDFINSLDKSRRAKVDKIYYLFEDYGFYLPGKYLKKLTKLVWELRPGDVRLLLHVKENVGYIVHAFLKKTQKTSKRDLKLAVDRIKREVL